MCSHLSVSFCSSFSFFLPHEYHWLSPRFILSALYFAVQNRLPINFMWLNLNFLSNCDMVGNYLLTILTWSFFYYLLILIWDFPSGVNGKEPDCQCTGCKRAGWIPGVGKIPWRRTWQPTPGFLPGESHEQRNMVGYSPWGCRVGHNWMIFIFTFIPISSKSKLHLSLQNWYIGLHCLSYQHKIFLLFSYVLYSYLQTPRFIDSSSLLSFVLSSFCCCLSLGVSFLLIFPFIIYFKDLLNVCNCFAFVSVRISQEITIDVS